MKAIVNGKIILENAVIDNKVLVFGEKILGLESYAPADAQVIDAKGMYVSPGLVDIHIHGCYGADVMDGVKDALLTISRGVAKTGVTSFLPTTMTYDWAVTQKALENVGENMGSIENGATILGSHLEGPFISAEYAGAQPKEYIVPPSFEMIKDYTNIIKLLTYAPEMDENNEFTKQIRRQTNITLSMGHTGATYEQGVAAYNNGVGNVTHTFNGMRGLTHREPGAAGAALTQPFFCELIADNIHVSPYLYEFLLKNKGADRLILITDSIAGGGMGDGTFALGGQPVTVKNGTARLANGALAGSVLSLNTALKNFKEHTNISLPALFGLASANPAKSIGVFSKGSLAIGKDADIAIFNENFECEMTICEGRIVWEKSVI
ncbi:MAG: N-acetylglucosamine-6-phosphate deacetylase [Defluviitaleaceae bacterium]|nr:N-acetylglucosamine-6-phosphate deacetylase [Defluviitaleaceae bacterium]